MFANNEFIPYIKSIYKNQWKNENPPKTKLELLLAYAKSAFALCGLLIMDAGIEVLFLIGFGYVIIEMSQGRDLIVSMFEPQGLYGTSRIFLTLASLCAFSISMWIIPAFIFEKKYRGSNQLESKDPFKIHLFFAHRILPMIPFWLMAFALFNDSGWFFILLAIVEIRLLSILNHDVKRSRTAAIFAGLLLAFIAAAIIFQSIYRWEYLWSKRLMALMLYLLSMILFMFYYEMDRKTLNEHFYGDKTRPAIKRYVSNTTFFLIYALIHFCLIFAIISQSIRIIAPESMLLYVFAFYLFVIDFAVYVWRINSYTQTGGTIIGLLLLILFVFGGIKFNTEQNRIDRIPIPAGLENHHLSSLDDYYQQWKQRIISNQSTRPFPIILIAGEGGGSRAGYWFSQNLIDFDYQTKGKFRQHVFSLSTVSGSTVGLGTYFAYLDLPFKSKKGDLDIPPKYLDLPSLVFKNNYVGSSISGLFITDLFHSFYNGGWEEDRNNVLMREESHCTAEAICQIANIPKDSFNNCILNREFMSLFYDSATNYKTFSMQRPLAFINTCRSNDGRRGIFTAIRLDSTVFNDAIDINGYLYKDSAWYTFYKKNRFGNRKGISFGLACLSSELFPIFSAPLYVDSLGSFVDGGYHENSGLKTTIDIYSRLKALLEKDESVKGRYIIYIMYLKNNEDKKNLYAPTGPSLGILQPINALMGQPFNGSASYFEEKAKYIGDTAAKTIFVKVPLSNRIFEDSLIDINDRHSRRIQREILEDLKQKNDSNSLNFPLARWLSQSVITRMNKCQIRNRANRNTEINKLLATIIAKD